MSKTATKKVTVNEKKKGKSVNALQSFKAIVAVMDRHRPYEPSDFVKEYYIPDI